MSDPFGWVDDPESDEDASKPVRLLLELAGVLAAAAVVVSYAIEGLVGLLVALSAIAVAAMVVAVVVVPDAPARPPRRARAVPVAHAPFRSYRQVAEQLSWAQVSPRHYDLITRPLLVQLLASRLADRHRIDLRREPGRARSLVGEDIWRLLDPDRPPDRSSQPPGIDRRTVATIVERLERL